MVNIQGLFNAFECFSSTFQGKFHFQGLFKTVLYIQVLFKPAPSDYVFGKSGFSLTVLMSVSYSTFLLSLVNFVLLVLMLYFQSKHFVRCFPDFQAYTSSLTVLMHFLIYFNAQNACVISTGHLLDH